MTGTAIDLSKLPAPTIVEELDFATIFEKRMARYQEIVEESGQEFTALVPSEPAYKIIEENSYRELVWRQRVNEAAKAVMVAFSKGTDLDQISANFETERLVITEADPTTTPPTEEVKEDDDSLRERTQESFEGLSVAGPWAAYELHARSADGRVSDAKAISPSPACVTVSILENNGAVKAAADLVQKVDTALTPEDVRPIADRVTTKAAEIINYEIIATAYLEDGPEAEPVMKAANDGAIAYATKKRRIGRNVNRSAINAAIHVEGISKLVITSPAADIEISNEQAAYCTGITILNGGVDGA